MDINRFSCLFQAVTMSSHTFLPKALGNHPVVVDLGANRGEFHRVFTGRFKPGRYLAVEANPVLAEGLRSLPGVEVLNVAIAASEGPVRFNIEENPEASHLAASAGANGIEIEGRTLRSILREAGVDRVDLLKVDIEGGELPMILESPAEVLAGIAQITIEFHDFCGIHRPAQVRTMIDHLRAAGFTGIQFSRDNTNWCFVRNGRVHPVRLWMAKHLTARLRRLKHRLG